jgi:hypothetical protein
MFIGTPVDPYSRYLQLITPIKPLSKRLPKLLVADRIHDKGKQWDDRRKTAEACVKRRDGLCSAMFGTMTGLNSHLDEWITTVSEYQFIIVTHGGGIDLCPKTFESIYAGTIPILQKSILDDSYSHLPIVFVDNIVDFLSWSNISIVMKEWMNELGKYYEPMSHLRNQTLHRLTTTYWHRQMLSKLKSMSV